MRGKLWLFVVLVIMILEVESFKKFIHRVGGGHFTWSPNVDFSDWANHESFYVGKWLYFGFDPASHNVLQVNKTSYEQCIDTDFTSEVTHGGRDMFHLNESKTYYFICSRGYCERQNMKLAVNVFPNTTSSTPTALAASTATTLRTPANALAGVATSVIIFVFKCFM